MQSYAHINEERVISLHAKTHWARFREEKKKKKIENKRKLLQIKEKILV